MASVRLNFFGNHPLLPQATNFQPHAAIGSLMLYGYYVPGSISFNTLAMLMSASGTTAKTLSISWGLYSLNGSTLSLANSASFSSNPGANALSWITLNTSATQDITPGNWYFGYMSSTSGQSDLFVIALGGVGGLKSQIPHGGPFVRGHFTASTSAFPASIATSNLSKELGQSDFNDYTFPYFLISA